IGWRSYLVKGPPVATAADVVDAVVVHPDRSSVRLESANVLLELSPEAARRFEEHTAANIKRRLAILVDGQVASAPVIITRIPGGKVSITMGAGNPESQLADARRLVRGLLGR